MSFNSIVLTDKGRTLLNKNLAGATLNFTKIKMGAGNLGGQSQIMLNDLIEPKISVSISSIKKNANFVSIQGNFRNADISTGFYWRELGIFALDPDIGEILYCYGNAASLAEYIPPQTSGIVDKVIGLSITVGNASNVNTIIDESLVFASKADIVNLLSKDGDASDTTNIFTISEIKENISSGEKISTTLGKIKKWFTDLKTIAFSASTTDISDPTAYINIGSVKNDAQSKINELIDDALGENFVFDKKRSLTIAELNNPSYPSPYVASVDNVNAPSIGLNAQYYHIFYFRHMANDGYGAQLAINLTGGNGMMFRTSNKMTWNPWVTVYHTNNLAVSVLNTGNNIVLRGSTGAINVGYVSAEGDVFPLTSSINSCGRAANRWTAIYATNGTIQTSDRNLKDNIAEMTDLQFEFFKRLIPVTYKFMDNQSNRTHYGFISQDIETIMAELGMESLDFAGFIKSPIYKYTYKRMIKDVETGEEKEEEYTDISEYPNPDEVVSKEFVEYIYSLRYDEFISLNTYVTQRILKEMDSVKSDIELLKQHCGISN